MKNKQKIKLLRNGLKYIHASIDRHAKVLEIHRTELAGVDAAVKGIVKLLNANRRPK